MTRQQKGKLKNYMYRMQKHSGTRTIRVFPVPHTPKISSLKNKKTQCEKAAQFKQGLRWKTEPFWWNHCSILNRVGFLDVFLSLLAQTRKRHPPSTLLSPAAAVAAETK